MVEMEVEMVPRVDRRGRGPATAWRAVAAI